MQRFNAAALAALLAATGAHAAISSSESARLAAAARVIQDVQTTIPAERWSSARCVAVFPQLNKTDFIVGGKTGKGVMSCRAGERWSAPAFLQITKGSRMSQMGAEQMDIVLLVMNEGGVQKLLQDKSTLGADVSIAPGPIDTQAQIAPEALTAEILSYSRAKGLFMNLAGGVLRSDRDANADVYGSGATLRTILASRDISAPVEAHALVAALNAQPAATLPPDQARTDHAATSAAVTGQAGSTPATARTTTMPTTDEDLRARVVDIQQTLDRILADTTPNAVGTSGRTESVPRATDAVTVDRARLLQMRNQLDALLAALNRR